MDNGRRNRRKVNKQRRWLWLGYMTAFSFLLTGVSFSKYVTGAYGTSSARTAAWAFSVTELSGENFEIKYGDGNENCCEYEFSVKNERSETALSYNVEVDTGESLPDGMTITLDGRTGTDKGGGKYVFYDVDEFPAGSAGSTITRSHTLKLEAHPDAMDNKEYDFEIDVSVLAEQID